MMTPHIIAVANQKGGCGKTTTAINLAQALALREKQVLLVDLDPQGNATQGMGIDLSSIAASVANLLTDNQVPIENAIYQGDGIDLIAATPLLARVEREMVGITNSELRLARRLRQLKRDYYAIIIDTPPTFGPLMNSALNAATKLLVPVDSGFFAMMGIKELLAEVEEIRSGTNTNLTVLGYLLTLADNTRMTTETFDGLVSGFGSLVFETKIRRTVKLREAPALGETIFQHSPQSTGSEDYLALSSEVLERLEMQRFEENLNQRNEVSSLCGGFHE